MAGITFSGGGLKFDGAGLDLGGGVTPPEVIYYINPKSIAYYETLDQSTNTVSNVSAGTLCSRHFFFKWDDTPTAGSGLPIRIVDYYNYSVSPIFQWTLDAYSLDSWSTFTLRMDFYDATNFEYYCGFFPNITFDTSWHAYFYNLDYDTETGGVWQDGNLISGSGPSLFQKKPGATEIPFDDIGYPFVGHNIGDNAKWRLAEDLTIFNKSGLTWDTFHDGTAGSYGNIYDPGDNGELFNDGSTNNVIYHSVRKYELSPSSFRTERAGNGPDWGTVGSPTIEDGPNT